MLEEGHWPPLPLSRWLVVRLLPADLVTDLVARFPHLLMLEEGHWPPLPPLSMARGKTAPCGLGDSIVTRFPHLLMLEEGHWPPLPLSRWHVVRLLPDGLVTVLSHASHIS